MQDSGDGKVAGGGFFQAVRIADAVEHEAVAHAAVLVHQGAGEGGHTALEGGELVGQRTAEQGAEPVLILGQSGGGDAGELHAAHVAGGDQEQVLVGEHVGALAQSVYIQNGGDQGIQGHGQEHGHHAPLDAGAGGDGAVKISGEDGHRHHCHDDAAAYVVALVGLVHGLEGGGPAAPEYLFSLYQIVFDSFFHEGTSIIFFHFPL